MATSRRGVPGWVLDALSGVYDPCCREKGISVVDMGLLRSATVNGTHARVELMLTSGWCPFATHLLSEIEDALLARPDVDTCDVEVVWDEAWTTNRLSESASASYASSPIPPPFPTATRSSPHSVRRPRRSTDDR